MARHIKVSELKATLSEQLARVKAGEELEVTERGMVVARIVPPGEALRSDRLERLARAGVVRLPTRRGSDPFKKPPVVDDPEGSVLQALLSDREEGR